MECFHFSSSESFSIWLSFGSSSFSSSFYSFACSFCAFSITFWICYITSSFYFSSNWSNSCSSSPSSYSSPSSPNYSSSLPLANSSKSCCSKRFSTLFPNLKIKNWALVSSSLTLNLRHNSKTIKSSLSCCKSAPS